VYAPGKTQALPWVNSTESPAQPAALSCPRAAQSPKGFFLPATESIARYGPGAQGAAAVETEPLTLIGVRACELRARKYLDKVMLEGTFEDPPYRRRSEDVTIVSCDCVACAETCFCTLVGGQPYATEGFDVNLTPMPDGSCLAEAATDAGKEWLKGRIPGLKEADQAKLDRRDGLRKEMVDRVARQNAPLAFTASDEAQPKLPDDGDGAWQKFAADCVECAACTHICPTCHCFYLYDQVLGAEEFERVRTWDSCLLSTYHRMAGGAGMKISARPKLSSRLANRVLHKFTYSPQQYDLLGCVGCGRCIDACLGAIDIRQVVEELGQ
jgi:sulfhydrogenase subunit beta (sulfur reductase)